MKQKYPENTPVQQEETDEDVVETPEYEEYTEYSYDGDEKVNEAKTEQNRPKESKDVGGYMKKLFKNLFE